MIWKQKNNFVQTENTIKTKRDLILSFFFPTYKFKLFKSTTLIVILASMMGLSFVLGALSIPIPAFGISLSFAWMPTMVVGWFFGPFVGLFFGFITDSLNFLMHGYLWFWLYAIQEPMVGFISGLIGAVALLSFKLNKKIWIDFISFQVVILSFAAICLGMMFHFTDPNSELFKRLVKYGHLSETFNEVVRWFILTLIIVFLGIVETIMIRKYYFMKTYSNTKTFIYFMYGALCCIIMTLIFSFILGPVSAIEYYKFMNGKQPNSYLKFGVIYYLLPRIVKECVKTPIYIFLFTGVISALRFQVDRVFSDLQNKW